MFVCFQSLFVSIQVSDAYVNVLSINVFFGLSFTFSVYTTVNTSKRNKSPDIPSRVQCRDTALSRGEYIDSLSNPWLVIP